MDKRIKVLKAINVLNAIADNMEKDAINYNGKEFNGETVGNMIGAQGAAIVALATIIKFMLEDSNNG